MKTLFAMLIIFASTKSFASGLAGRVSDVCPQGHMYTDYALYNVEDYFWVFADEAKTQLKSNKSVVTLVNPNDQKQFALLAFNKLTVFGWTNVGGMTAGAKGYLPYINKMVDAGWTLCARSTTGLGIKQLEHILKTGEMDSSFSNR
ncbi:hypothetical protein [Bdellovibrio svalbardensis]|uniref:Uncharacterized protein n=1 Tax=Bdellovibrio svalbardensis TaxID=2972972 RepID=A0ABT6DI39_9BACT|nr:hypothetical protein [Bdellovibrio svalbardensis]MDG0815900.1 hypothetical protein [Bdellovibrio svalbardensis]